MSATWYCDICDDDHLGNCPVVLDAAFTEEHEDAIAAACEKLWNGEPVEDPVHSPRPKNHPLVEVANAAHEALNAALTLRVQYYKMRQERDALLAMTASPSTD